MLILVGTVFAVAAGVYAVQTLPLDAIPDLSDVQVIVYTEYPGPGAAGGRGPGHLSADDGDADRAEIEGGARLLVLRRLVRLRHLRRRHRSLLGAQPRARISQRGARKRLPAGVTPTLGPDATGVGWVYQYAVVAKDMTLAELRSLQDWIIRFALSKAEGVAEVASVGGFVKQYNIVVDPLRLRAQGISARQAA